MLKNQGFLMIFLLTLEQKNDKLKFHPQEKILKIIKKVLTLIVEGDNIATLRALQVSNENLDN